MTSQSWLRYHLENTVALLILNSHRGFYLEGPVEDKTSNSSSTFLSPQRFPPKSRKYSICPVIGGHVEPPEHLWGRDRFGIHPHFPVWLSTICHGFHQDLDAGGFPGPAGPQGHHPMPHTLRFKQLDDFQFPRKMVD